jgi:hypothetical protein
MKRKYWNVQIELYADGSVKAAVMGRGRRAPRLATGVSGTPVGRFSASGLKARRRRVARSPRRWR